MDITGNNVAFFYRAGDADSLEVAEYYRDARNVPGGQLVAIACSDEEVLSSPASFAAEVEDLVNTAITTPPLSGRDIYVIILGYNVPGGFYDGQDLISSVSRIMRIGHAYSKKQGNTFYIQKSENGLYVPSDNTYAYIAARIDAPTVAAAKAIIDNNTSFIRQRVVNGRFYLDPYFGLSSELYDSYQAVLYEFAAKNIPQLKTPLRMTVTDDPYTDPAFACLEQDSFYWGGLADYASDSFFLSTNTTRVFLYSMDAEPAATIKDSTETQWVEVALNNGYCSAAGGMSATSPDEFLSANGFFTTLEEGGIIGEAFLFSLPYFNCPITFIGDPLATATFPEYNTDVVNQPNLFCTSYGFTAAPYGFLINIDDIELPDSDDCWNDDGDRFRISTINVDPNGLYRLKLAGNCLWSKRLPYSLTSIRWFAPIADPDPCNDIPTSIVDGEVVQHHLDISMTISKVASSTGVYYVHTTIQTPRQDVGHTIKPKGYIKVFDGGFYYHSMTRDWDTYMFNTYLSYSIGTSSVTGKNGTIQINKQYFINGQESIFL